MIVSENLIYGSLVDGSGELPVLEKLCEMCDGKGKIDPYRVGNAIHSGGECQTCSGAGSIATEDGKRLLAFMKRRQISRR